MWFNGVEVAQETSAPPPKKNPGSAHERNALVPKFDKLQSSFTTDLYYHECCLIKPAIKKLDRREQLLDCEANSKVICLRRNLSHRKGPLISRETTWIVSAPKELCLTNRTIFSS